MGPITGRASIVTRALPLTQKHSLQDMEGDIDWNLLGRYLLGNPSEADRKKVQAWIEEDPARKVVLDELRQVLGTTHDPDLPATWDANALWKRVKEQTQTPEVQQEDDDSSSEGRPARTVDRSSRGAPDRPSRRSQPRRSRRGRTTRQLARPAAWAIAIAVMVVVSAALWLRGSAITDWWGPSTSEVRTFATQKGQRAAFRLADGTRVRLNVDSRLTVPASFGDGQRAVQLQGEAFFEVSEDSLRPFVIRAGEAVTQVLGTAFDVSAYPEDGETRVVVAEGRVALRAGRSPEAQNEEPFASSAEEGRSGRRNGDAPVEGVVLTNGQMGAIRQGGAPVVRQPADVKHHLAWMDGRLAFRKASFSEVTRRLARWYGLEIRVEGAAIPLGRLNAEFEEDRPLREVLSVVATAYDLEYERRDRRVTFRPLPRPR